MSVLLPIFASDQPARVRGGVVGLSIAISLGFAVGLATTFATAQAADTTIPSSWNQLPLKAPPAPASSFDWNGFYVGGHVGYMFGTANATLGDPTDPALGLD